MLKNRQIFLPAIFIIWMVVLFQVVTLIQSGCIGKGDETEVRRVTMDLGAQESTSSPTRIVSMSPNLTEIIFALGAGDLIVAVDDYSVYPPEAQDKPTVGNYLDPDLESLIAIQPDMVLVVDNDERMADMLTDLGLNYRSYANDSIREILQSIEDLGALVGHPDEAQRMIDRFQSARMDVTSRLEGVERRSVALVVGRNTGRLQDIYVAGRGNFLSEMIEIAGGANIFSSREIVWPQVGVESFIGGNPVIIIDSTLAKGATDEEFASLESDWDELSTVSAVKNGNIIIPREGWFQIPGANLDRILLLIAHWIHPDIFPDVESPYAQPENMDNQDETETEPTEDQESD